MLRFWKQRLSASASPFGHLEATVMEILWHHGASSVRDVAGRLPRPLAYTTVMTTLDRLYKKGVLERRNQDRAFIYAPRYTRAQWEQKRAGEFLSGLEPDVLVSCLVEAAGDHDAALLDELERQIRLKRRELRRKQQ